MKIQKLNYSREPWRLVDSQGCEIQVRQAFAHPGIGMTVVSASVSGDTKAECTDKALALLERLLTKLA